MRSPSLLASLVLVALSITACGGAGNVGESCERPGSIDDCVDGAICATDEAQEGDSSDPVWESYTCRVTCTTTDECEVGQECRGVTGAFSVRACQPTRTP